MLPSFAGIKIETDKPNPIEIAPTSSSGLKSVWVAFDASNCRLIFDNHTESAASIKWYKFSKLGGAYAEPVNSTIIDGVSTLTSVEGDMGYIAEDGNQKFFVWIVDYSSAKLLLNSIEFSPESDCDMTILNINGECPPLVYYSINGQRISIDRELALSYNTLQWNSESHIYSQTEVTKTISGFDQSVMATAPLCNTTFTLSGDRFLQAWNQSVSIESDLYTAMAVEVNATASRTNSDGTGSELGGSAPAIVDFEGFYSDAAIFREWQITKDSEFEEILYRFSDDRITFTFSESGNYYARYVGANASGGCESISETFEINIGESRLECPNAFSPESDIESAKIWRVSYNSIVDFECHIFNRYGIEMYSYADPSGGWDGTYKGKKVGTGVYFYVITAKGADGKEYNLKGDINILNLKKDL